MPYVVRHRQPSWLQRGVARTLSIEIEEAGALISAPSAATYTLRNAAGTAVTGLSAAAGTAAAGGATFALGATVLDNESYSSSYTETWALTIGGVARTFTRQAVICRVEPFAPLTAMDLQRAHPDLLGDWLLPSGVTSWQPFVDESWDELVARLLGHGLPVHQIVGWHTCRRLLKRMALLEIATHLAMARDGTSRWADLASVLGGPLTEPRSIEAAWAELVVRLDRDEDGAVDTSADSEIRPNVYGDSPAVPAWRGF